MGKMIQPKIRTKAADTDRMNIFTSTFHPIVQLRRRNPHLNAMMEGVAAITSEQDR
jgi:hypothetical protein